MKINPSLAGKSSAIACRVVSDPPASPSLPVLIIPRLLRIQDAARYLSSTTWFVETLIREKQIPSLIIGKRRVIDINDLDAWIEKQKPRSVAESCIDIAA